MEATETYVGELIRKAIKDAKITNGYVISELINAGLEMSAPKFSTKIYGVNDRFTYNEVKAINKIKILKQSFPLPEKTINHA